MVLWEMIVDRSSLSNNTPGTSVIRMSFSASMPAAISPATRSALIFSACPSESAATLAITGMIPSCTMPTKMSVLMPVTSPTNPRSPAVICRARMRSPSFPHSPTAFPPAWLMSETIDLFTFPTRTISTTSMVAASVTRSPFLKFGSMPSFVSQELISGPPPCTRMGRMPRHDSSTTSLTTCSFSVGSFIAAPPYFTTTVRPLNFWMYGRASERICTL
mmetsp:Transcript_16483/g.19771  ORF Transcript_16483/g.19771 Transcript_16483/m.19771 type:complete len:218 (+) Transcript_16483:466-1119(+)